MGPPDPDGPYADALLMDGFEDALIGYGLRFTYAVAVYDRDRCLAVLVASTDMTGEEAEEYFEFNCQGAYVGEHTPVILEPLSDAAAPSPGAGSAPPAPRTWRRGSSSAGAPD